MKSLLTLFAFAATTCITAVAQACGGLGFFHDDNPESVERVEQFVQEMRALGPEGLTAALEEYSRGCRGQKGLTPETHKRWQAALDQIAAQRGAATSRLYWYTDLEAAKVAAEKSEKPILSLRMLGKLTDEYSCANSRFFRTTLYANEEISNALRERFVLHWQSVRPVPKVTIDFGDGRKLERTLTGNSAHYILSPQGRPLDVLPGLYSPQKFLSWLGRVEQLAQHFIHIPKYDRVEPTRIRELRRYHQKSEQAILAAWRKDLVTIGTPQPLAVPTTAFNNAIPPKAPLAKEAMPLAMSKSLVEAPLLPLVAEQPANEPASPDAVESAQVAVAKRAVAAPMIRNFVARGERLDKTTSDEQWEKIAALHRDETKLDPSSVAVIRNENEDPREAARRASSKRRVEDPILALVQEFESNITLDTVKNEYQLHRRIHRWFLDGTITSDFDQLNEKVYAELFLTPSSDPWLGLAPANVYTALDKGGKVAQ
ncbi:MAG: hypothetical protein RH917_20180 [Lacipirellulaceae bacterium]